MDGIFLSAKEKRLNRDMFRTMEVKTVPHQSLVLAINNKKKLITGRYENEIEPTMQSIVTLIDAYQKNKFRNANLYCAGAAEILCIENKLSGYGSRTLFDEIVRKKKTLPSIAELNTEAIQLNNRLNEFQKFFNQQTKKYYKSEKEFLNRLENAKINLHGTYFEGIEDLGNIWNFVFPYSEIMCRRSDVKYNEEYDELIIEKLSLPRKGNILFFLLQTMMVFFGCQYDAFEEEYFNIEDINKDSILSEIKQQFPDVKEIRPALLFLTPSQWKRFKWENVKIDSKNWDEPFQPFPPEWIRSIVQYGLNQETYEYLNTVSKPYFDMEDMFE